MATQNVPINFFPSSEVAFDGDEMSISENSDSSESDDSFEEPPSWKRLPSQETEYSDWQLDVQFHGRSETLSYAVHRYKLGHRSSYFRAIFGHSEAFIESNVMRSHIVFSQDLPVEIHQTDFEFFLDMLYQDDIYYYYCWADNPERILSMIYLSDYFGVKDLRKAAIEQARDLILYADAYDSPFMWIAKLYWLADSLSIKKIRLKIETFCYKLDYGKDGILELLGNLPTLDLKRTFFLRMNKVFKKEIEKRNGQQSRQFIRYVLQAEPEVVDARVFFQLVLDLFEERSKVVGFWLHAEDALLYLKHEQRVGLDGPETHGLTPLQEECVTSLSRRDRNPYRRTHGNPWEIMEMLGTLKPAISRALLFQFLDFMCPKADKYCYTHDDRNISNDPGYDKGRWYIGNNARET